jgi:ribose transport system permease protein
MSAVLRRPRVPEALLQALPRLLALLILCVALSLLSDVFPTWGNAINVLRQTSLLFISASGLTFVVLTAGLDLSVGSTIGLAACVAGTVIKATGEPLLGVLCGIGVGAAAGLLNGLMVAMLRIPSFIATYGMLWVLQGLAYFYMAGQAVFGFPHGFRQLGRGLFIGIPIPIFVMAAVLALGSIILRRTTIGQQIYAIGGNPVSARLSGVPVRRRLLLVYVLSGTMAGLASLVFLAQLNSAQADIGSTLTLPAIAAVLVGGTSLFGGVGSLSGTFIGALLLTVVLNGMNLLDVDAAWQPLATGCIILAAVYLDTRASRSRRG